MCRPVSFVPNSRLSSEAFEPVRITLYPWSNENHTNGYPQSVDKKSPLSELSR